MSIFFGSLGAHTVLRITIDSALFLRYFQETRDYDWILLLREIVFAKSKVYVKGYQETLHSELSPFTTETEDEKTMLLSIQPPLQKRGFKISNQN